MKRKWPLSSAATACLMLLAPCLAGAAPVKSVSELDLTLPRSIADIRQVWLRAPEADGSDLIVVKNIARPGSPPRYEFTNRGTVPVVLSAHAVQCNEDRSIAIPLSELARLEPGQSHRTWTDWSESRRGIRARYLVVTIAMPEPAYGSLAKMSPSPTGNKLLDLIKSLKKHIKENADGFR